MQRSAILIVQSGSLKSRTFPLRDETTIGRDKSNTICFSDQRVSRKHCQILRRGTEYLIRDMNSKNGTFLNNMIIKEAMLNKGDTIRIGSTVLTFHYKDQKGNTSGRDIYLVSTDPKQTIVLHRMSGKAVRDIDREVTSGIQGERAQDILSMLYRISSSIYAIKDIDTLFSRILNLIFEEIPAERGVILLFDETASALIPRASHIRDKSQKKKVKISFSICSEAFRENTSLLIQDAQKDKRFDSKTSIAAEAIRSVLCAPVGIKEKTFGLIYLDTRFETQAFTEETLRLITALGRQLGIAVENIRFREAIENTAENLHLELRQEYNMVGVSKGMKDIFTLIQKAAGAESTVLVTGESGTGKELVARAIHYNSGRSKKPFICINCSAMPDTLIESELFGHEKGSFTGAYAAKPGQFELAKGGTIFLDEIGEMPLESQTKLLRVLEENTVRHIGGLKDIKVDTRIIAASNKNLEEAVRIGSFRKDLYYRLKVIEIYIPPLKERKEDISALAEYYFEKFRHKSARPLNGISKEAIHLMKDYSWPGNVRELKNCIERAIVMGRKEYIGPKDLDIIPQEMPLPKEGNVPSLADMEKEHIIKALSAAGGNKTKAAKMLGIRRSTLYEKLKLYEIE